MLNKDSRNRAFTTPLLINFGKHNREESPIANDEFLESFYRFGACLRVVTAYQQYKILQQPGSSQLERFAAAVCLYQTLGMLYEDLAATVIAWSVWAADRTQLLADIYKRTFLKSEPEPVSAGAAYHEWCVAEFLKKTRTVRICAPQFFESLASLHGEDILRVLGIQWKQHPSVKLVPRDQQEEWRLLPGYAKELLTPLGDPRRRLLSEAYNKLKHGPQLVVMNPRSIAIERRGFTEEETKPFSDLDSPHIRLLFQGARTQEKPGELESGTRVAPFLIHKPEIIEGTLLDHVTARTLVQVLARWLHRSVFGSVLPRLASELDPILDRIIREFHDRSLKRV